MAIKNIINDIAIGKKLLGGFGIVHGPNMDVSQSRIVKWESAA